jgi:hypothetical protein
MVTWSRVNDLISHLTIRLFDILHQDQKLYLVFEFVDMDLKKYMDTVGNAADGLSDLMVKVSCPGSAKSDRDSISLTDLLSLFVEIHLPTHQGSLLLSRPPSPAPRLEAPESIDR